MRIWRATHQHGRPRETTADHGRSQNITGDHWSSREITVRRSAPPPLKTHRALADKMLRERLAAQSASPLSVWHHGGKRLKTASPLKADARPRRRSRWLREGVLPSDVSNEWRTAPRMSTHAKMRSDDLPGHPDQCLALTRCVGHARIARWHWHPGWLVGSDVGAPLESRVRDIIV